MESKRDKLKRLNSSEKKVVNESTTIIDELVEQYAKEEKVTESIPEKDLMNEKHKSELINVIDKSNVGRPKILEGVYKPISARLKMENYEHARNVGGKYGGMNAYINWLIEQDMKK